MWTFVELCVSPEAEKEGGGGGGRGGGGEGEEGGGRREGEEKGKKRVKEGHTTLVLSVCSECPTLKKEEGRA